MWKSLSGIAAAFAIGTVIGTGIVGQSAPAQAFKFKGDCFPGFTKQAGKNYFCKRGFGLLCKTGYTTPGPYLNKTAKLVWYVGYQCLKP